MRPNGLIIRWSLVRVQPAPPTCESPAQEHLPADQGSVQDRRREHLRPFHNGKTPGQSTCADQRIEFTLGHAKALVIHDLIERITI